LLILVLEHLKLSIRVIVLLLDGASLGLEGVVLLTNLTDLAFEVVSLFSQFSKIVEHLLAEVIGLFEDVVDEHILGGLVLAEELSVLRVVELLELEVLGLREDE